MVPFRPTIIQSLGCRIGALASLRSLWRGCCGKEHPGCGKCPTPVCAVRTWEGVLWATPLRISAFTLDDCTSILKMKCTGYSLSLFLPSTYDWFSESFFILLFTCTPSHQNNDLEKLLGKVSFKMGTKDSVQWTWSSVCETQMKKAAKPQQEVLEQVGNSGDSTDVSRWLINDFRL